LHWFLRWEEREKKGWEGKRKEVGGEGRRGEGRGESWGGSAFVRIIHHPSLNAVFVSWDPLEFCPPHALSSSPGTMLPSRLWVEVMEMGGGAPGGQEWELEFPSTLLLAHCGTD
jgi:hypothetical protein